MDIVTSQREAAMHGIVVGVDGSPGSAAALAFAIEEARHRRTPLTVIHAYHPSPHTERRPTEEFDVGVSVPVGFSRAVPPSDEVSRRAATQRRQEDYRRAWARTEAEAAPARALVEQMLHGTGATDGIEVTPLAVADGHPAEVLITAAADAELLVVGSRGRGGFAGLLTGSVSQQCVTHAGCPVVVVPTPRGS